MPDSFPVWIWRVGSGRSKGQRSPDLGSMGMYEFLCMPYGLVQNCLGELNLMYALIYLDDVIVYSKMEEEDLVHLWFVLEKFMEISLKLKLSKYNFFWMEISYLGHKVSAAGLELGNEGLKGIAEIMPMAMYTQVHKFLGAIS